MWRRHQAVKSTLQSGRFCTSIGGNHHNNSSRCLYGAAASFAFSSIISSPPWLATFLSDSRHLSFIAYRETVGSKYYPDQLLISCRASSTRRRNQRPRLPRMKDLHSVEQVIATAYENLDVMSRINVSAVWSRIPQLLTKRQQKQRSKSTEKPSKDIRHMMYAVFDDTTGGIVKCNIRELTETILGMAKIVKILRKRGEDNYRIILRELLLNKDMKPIEDLFRFFASASIDKLGQFDARYLSNLSYAYALIGYVPKFDDGRDLFDHIAEKAVWRKGEFNAQEISNMVWAFATVEKPNCALFEAIGDQIIANDHLGEFTPQALSNIVWAYEKAGFHYPKLFEKVANHIIGLDHLDKFKPQAISNTVWAYEKAGIHHEKLFERVANHIIGLDHLDKFQSQDFSNTVLAYAKAGVPYSKLFEKMANHIAELDHLNRFDPQALSNSVWAYAKAGIHHPKLFERVADHIIELDHLNKFKPQELSNTVWAYATSQVTHLELFQKIAKGAIERKGELFPQEVANLLWAYATMGIVDKHLFSSFAPQAAKMIDSYNNQELANIAWAFAVVDVDATTLFNNLFTDKLHEKKDGFEKVELFQLHQWHLWQTNERSHSGLPTDLQYKCYGAFVSEESTVSQLQDDVVAQLSSTGLQPNDEVLLDSGYRIDALVEVNGKTVGVEVDGPSHFVGRSKSPIGGTILKRRQVPLIDDIELVCVPYWEWNELGRDQEKKQEYLRKLLAAA